MTWDCIVIGAGCAGMGAATRLAEAGHRVLVLEKRRILGGRASSFTDSETGEVIDNGQHLFLGCYRETRKLLRRIGTEHLLEFENAFSATMVGPERKAQTLRTRSLPAPWHLGVGLLGYTALSRRDRINTLRVARAAQKNNDNWGSKSVREWLTELGQSQRSQDRLWDPITLATLNISPERAPAELLAIVLREGFLASREDSTPGLSRVGLSDLYANPSAEYIRKNGGEVRNRDSVAKLLVENGRIQGVEFASGERELAKTVISTIPPSAFMPLAKNVPELQDVLDKTYEMQSSPIVSLHIWPKMQPFEEMYVGFYDRPFHWAFRKQAIYGKPTVRHVSMVISGAEMAIKMSKSDLLRLAYKDLSLMAPNKKIEIDRVVLVREPEATWIPPLKDASARPGAETKIPNFFLAGDWTATGLPATIEGAVLSGHKAAEIAALQLTFSKLKGYLDASDGHARDRERNLQVNL